MRSMWYCEGRIPPRANRVRIIGGFLGGASRDRTDDLIVANDALSQLSYSPTETRLRCETILSASSAEPSNRGHQSLVTLFSILACTPSPPPASPVVFADRTNLPCGLRVRSGSRSRRVHWASCASARNQSSSPCDSGLESFLRPGFRETDSLPQDSNV